MDGLEKIVDGYYRLATQGRNRGDYAFAHRMITRGLSVKPDSQSLRNLDNEISLLANADASPAEPEIGIQAMAYDQNPVNPYSNNDDFTVSSTNEDGLVTYSVAGLVDPYETPIEVTTTEPQISEYDETVYADPSVSYEYEVAAQPVYAPVSSVQYTAPQATVISVTPPQTTTVAQPVRQAQTPAAALAQPVRQAPTPTRVATVSRTQSPPATAPRVTAAPAQPVRQTQTIAAAPRVTTPPPVAHTSVTAQPATARPQLGLTTLINRAERQFAAGHYTGPAGDNAWETYRRVLKYEALNPDAMIGLGKIADYYHTEAEKLILMGDPLAAIAMIEQGLKVRPDHKGLRQLQANSQILLAKEQTKRKAGGEPTTVSKRKKVKMTRQVAKLLEQSREHLENGEFSKSLSLLEQGLQIDPGNPELVAQRADVMESLSKNEEKWEQEQRLRQQKLARQQKLKFEVSEMQAKRLLAQAKREYVQGKYNRSLQTIEKGLKIMPEHVGLLSMRDEVEAGQRKTATVQTSKAVETIVAGIVAKAKEQRNRGALGESLKLIQTGLSLDPRNRQLNQMLRNVEQALNS